MFRSKLFGLSAVVIVAGVCFVATYAISQEKAGGDPAHAGGAPEQDAMMKAWMETAAPGKHHKSLEAMVGNFKYVSKFKMDPAQEWTTSEGEYTGEMCLGGRFLLSQVRGPMMGMQFEGMGALGYDNVAQKHVAAWIDSMGTGILRSEGTCSDDCKTITFEGEMLDAMTKKMTAYKYVYQIKSNDEFEMRWWSPNMADGKMFESMVITYTRVK